MQNYTKKTTAMCVNWLGVTAGSDRHKKMVKGHNGHDGSNCYVMKTLKMIWRVIIKPMVSRVIIDGIMGSFRHAKKKN